MRRKVLVTGAAGVIGAYAVNGLEDMGCDVLAISRSGRGPAGIALDMKDTEALNKFISSQKPEYLLHLAWNINKGYMNSSENLEWLALSLNLLKAFAANGGKRAVFAGSCFEYDCKHGLLQEDITPLDSGSLYGESKASLYKLASLWAGHNGLSFAWGRIFFIYGIGERDERIVPYVINSFLRHEKPDIKYPYVSRDYLYAGDAADALIALMFSSFNGAVNIASGHAVPLCEIVRITAGLMGCSVPEYRRNYDGDSSQLIMADVRRLNNIIGFVPAISWEKGLDIMIHYYKRGDYLQS